MEFRDLLMRDQMIELGVHLWLAANRIASYAMLNLVDDPAILAMAFC
jgi:hypothetical protein